MRHPPGPVDPQKVQKKLCAENGVPARLPARPPERWVRGPWDAMLWERSPQGATGTRGAAPRNAGGLRGSAPGE